MKTLMATDGSKESTTALRTASRLIRQDGNEVDVLCVAPEFYPLKSKSRAASANQNKIRQHYQRRIAQETKAILDKAMTALLSRSIAAHTVSEIGSPADIIVRMADEYEVTVVGSKGKFTAANVGLGPVASRVVERAQGVVLVARELTTDENLRVLIAVDGSLASINALKVMREFFNLSGAEITLIHVKETPWIHLGLEREWFDYATDTFDKSDPEIQLEIEFQREAEAVLEEAQNRLDKLNYSVSTVIQEGNPATEILGEAENGDYDLIILGATGSVDAKHHMLGSVSAKVAWQAPCSVAIVRFIE
ncbi:MAG: universal stress protein [Acidobacteriota bacterium]